MLSGLLCMGCENLLGFPYLLIIGIESPEVDVDLWTPINVANKVTVEVEQ